MTRKGTLRLTPTTRTCTARIVGAQCLQARATTSVRYARRLASKVGCHSAHQEPVLGPTWGHLGPGSHLDTRCLDQAGPGHRVSRPPRLSSGSPRPPPRSPGSPPGSPRFCLQQRGGLRQGLYGLPMCLQQRWGVSCSQDPVLFEAPRNPGGRRGPRRLAISL